MRRIIVSTLLLSTVLLHAQTGTKGQSATLVAHNDANASTASATASPATDVDTTTPARRISTGVTWPKLISEPTLSVSSADFPTPNLAAQHVVVGFRVDETGAPQNVHLVKSVSQTVDERVLAAVRQYRFVPGTLDDQKVPVDVNLVINFQEK
ncbi:MAG: TonB family protein [Terracidiphilus sp.]